MRRHGLRSGLGRGKPRRQSGAHLWSCSSGVPQRFPRAGAAGMGNGKHPYLGAVLDVKSLKWSSEPTLEEAPPQRQAFSLSLSRSLSETASAVRNGGSGSGWAVEPSRPL